MWGSGARNSPGLLVHRGKLANRYSKVRFLMRIVQIVFTLCLLVFSNPMLASSDEEARDARFEDVKWQTGNATIMTLFEPYIGVFASTVKTSPTGNDYLFKIRYEWYDGDKTIVKYGLEIEFPEQGTVREIGEGYYRFDPLSGRIAVVGVFRDGRSGAGFITPFDLETGSREVRVRAPQRDGTAGEVRDTFWVIDEDTWGNRTFMRSSNAPWQQVSEDVYRRVVP